MIKSFVPVGDVFSHALSGFGCLHEDEVVLLGKPMKVLAMRTDTLKPLSMDNPLQQELLEKLKNIDMTNIDETFKSIVDRKESIQKLSSGKKSHTPKWKSVEEIVDFEVLGASPDDSEEDRDDIVKESVGGDWMQWDPCREIRTAAYELAGIDEY